MDLKKFLVTSMGGVLASLAMASPAMAISSVVNDPGDGTAGAFNGVCDADTMIGGNQCTLREAVVEANGAAAGIDPVLDVITFTGAGIGTINVGAEIEVKQQLRIVGAGSGTGVGDTIIDGGGSGRLFHSTLFLNQPTLTIENARLQNGNVSVPTGPDGGGAIRAEFNLNLTNVVLTLNTVSGAGDGRGGAIFQNSVSAPVNLVNSTVSTNTVSTTGTGTQQGGGIDAPGPLNLTDSTVSGNQVTAGASQVGAGIASANAFNIQRSTISGNGGVLGGGGIAVAASSPGVRSITNSTISGNNALGGGGASFQSDATITNSTFANNGAVVGRDVMSSGAGTDVNVTSSILGTTPDACNLSGGTITSSGNNIDRDTSCGFATTPGDGDLDNTDPLLVPLTMNPPGTTETHALTPGSPAIDTGALTGLATDQRGVARPQGGRCDIGAFELEAAGDAPSCAGFPVITPPALTPTPPTPTPVAPKKKCKKKKKKKKKKGKGAAAAKKCKKKKS